MFEFLQIFLGDFLKEVPRDISEIIINIFLLIKAKNELFILRVRDVIFFYET